MQCVQTQGAGFQISRPKLVLSTALFIFTLLCSRPASSSEPPGTAECGGYLSQNVGTLPKLFLKTFLSNHKVHHPDQRIEALRLGNKRLKKTIFLVEKNDLDFPSAQALDSRIREQIGQSVRLTPGFWPWVSIGLHGTNMIVYSFFFAQGGLESFLPTVAWRRFYDLACPAVFLIDSVRYCLYRIHKYGRARRYEGSPIVTTYVENIPAHLRSTSLAGATIFIYTTPARFNRIRDSLIHEQGFVPVMAHPLLNR